MRAGIRQPIRPPLRLRRGSPPAPRRGLRACAGRGAACPNADGWFATAPTTTPPANLFRQMPDSAKGLAPRDPARMGPPQSRRHYRLQPRVGPDEASFPPDQWGEPVPSIPRRRLGTACDASRGGKEHGQCCGPRGRHTRGQPARPPAVVPAPTDCERQAGGAHSRARLDRFEDLGRPRRCSLPCRGWRRAVRRML